MTVKIRDPSLAIQLAIKTRIAAALPTTPLYDDVPDKSAYPYLVIGDDIETPWFHKDKGGVEHVATIRCWSQFSGSEQVKSILGTVRETITQNGLDLSASNFTVAALVFESLEVIREGDGLTRQGILRLRFNVHDLI